MATAHVVSRNEDRTVPAPANEASFTRELQPILISLIEASQRVLCLSKDAAEIFTRVQGEGGERLEGGWKVAGWRLGSGWRAAGKRLEGGWGAGGRWPEGGGRLGIGWRTPGERRR